ncbi:ankyrin repeat protein [Pseudomonas sp. PvR086]|jgi:ankyrin repeat protein|uniref:ankyrin repeat domain-containing protein n=1 Tax=Pseudomonas TaxID=286 RepID=UPI0011242E1F|nr:MULTISPECIES: ankyrin repeat domain-containing protein [Pseudomonas]MBD9608795.1 ankyrin repeat domain-containing protein [Pseudomonas sp. PDM08]MDR7108665.1 ankyrin repeat protein [Pseudomonas frederiksbergensis]
MPFSSLCTRAALLALLLNLPLAAQAIQMDWFGLPPQAVVDTPEYKIAIVPTAVTESATGVSPPMVGLLSQYRGLFYLNVYRDENYRERAYKLGPIPLMTAQEFHDCTKSQENLVMSPSASHIELAPGIAVNELSFECGRNGWDTRRYLLVDSRNPGTPLLAIGRVPNDQHLVFQALQATLPDTSDAWLKALESSRPALRYHVPDEAFGFSIAAQPYDAGDGAKQLRELHQQLAKAKDKGPGLKKVEELFLNTDFRVVGADQKDFAGLLNDIAFWRSANTPDKVTINLLKEVIRRDPQRIPTYLNMADLQWSWYEKTPAYTTNHAQALEYYRIYCGLRLARDMSIPDRVLERLNITQGDPQTCKAQWPLLQAVDAQDETRVRSLLEAGIPADTQGEDGRSALLHSLDKPNFAIARLLLEHGAKTQGLNGSEPLVMQALYKDRRESKDPEKARRLKFLLEAGAAIDETDLNGETVLMQHATIMDSDLFTWLLKYPQNLDLREKKEGRSALYLTIESGAYPAAARLINSGAQLDVGYREGTCNSNEEVLEPALLRLARRDLSSGMDPVAYQQQTLDLFTLMLEKGADPRAGHQCKGDNLAVMRFWLKQRKREDMLQVLQRYFPEEAGSIPSA